MLLQPLSGALIVYHRFAWPVLPACAAVVLVFLAREPLITLARQRWLWRAPRPETARAKRFLLIEIPLLAIAGGWLTVAWPLWAVVTLGGFAGGLTALAVYITMKNRQRAIWFQALSAAGLGSSALAVCVSMEGSIPWWGWWFWALHAAHFLAAILVVHARLESRIAIRKQTAFRIPREVEWVQYAMLAAGAALIGLRMPFYGAAALLSGGAHVIGLHRLHTPETAAVPMKTVGLRAMTLSIAFTLLVVAGSLSGLV